MAYPAIHFLWGYMISKKMDRGIEYLMIGLTASIVMDFDFIVGFVQYHRQMTHSLPFIFLLSVIIFIYYGKIKVFIITFFNLLSHLALDGLNSPIYWFEPFSKWQLGIERPFSSLYFSINQVILTIIPLFFILYRYHKEKENPFEIVNYFKKKYGKYFTYFLVLFTIIGFILTFFIAIYFL